MVPIANTQITLTPIGTITAMRSPNPPLLSATGFPAIPATVSGFQDNHQRRKVCGPYHEVTKRSRITFDPPTFTAPTAKRARREVSFEKVVRVRYLPPADPDDKERRWIPNKELAEFKTSAKMMCKRHLILRLVSRKQTKFPPTVEETTRFSVNFGSDSLRGLEHLTSVERCRERATRLRDTNDAICQSQKEQLLNQSLDRVHKNDSQTGDFLDFALDQSMLAQVYREKCRGAIKYSLRVAQEDARVAKAILLEVEGCT